MPSVLGLGGGYFHDSSACLMVDGEVNAFAEEERFTRRKQNKGSLSCKRSARYCLAEAGLQLADVDCLAIGWNPAWPEPPSRSGLRETAASMLGGLAVPHRTEVVRFDHHRAHAASAFYCSGYRDAAVVVVDGAGDGIASSSWRGAAGHLGQLEARPIDQSLGWFFEAAAEHLGLGRWSAGKLMGLAAYGDADLEFPFLSIGGDAPYRFDTAMLGLSAHTVRSLPQTFNYVEDAHAAFAQAFCDMGVPAAEARDRYDKRTGRWPRELDFTAHQLRFAASVQRALEDALVEVVSHAVRAVGSGSVCLAGGVAFNCAANGAIARAPSVAELYVQPVAGDAGIALGAALLATKDLGRGPFVCAPMTTTAFGPSFDDDAVANLLTDLGLEFRDVGADLEQTVAHRIAEGACVGWFQGRMEAGPRALGGRSILADPRDEASRERVNQRIKHREPWRPLAPSIRRAEIDRWSSDSVSPFMIVATRATPEARTMVPAVVHADGSMRAQDVAPGSRYAQLLDELAKQTGVGVVLNTSFNDDDEPIVCSPLDALRTFHSTELDLLAIGSILLEKPRAPRSGVLTAPWAS